MFYVYILRTSKNTLYVGQTGNLQKRISEHQSKKTKAKYLKMFSSFKLVYQETQPTRSLALKREAQLKKLTHAQKEMLINQNNNSL